MFILPIIYISFPLFVWTFLVSWWPTTFVLLHISTVVFYTFPPICSLVFVF
ncbi:hypothetical protein HD554DRAFT_2086032 [Boletus coccyginus]|nr:hypothetical protein HD554DRAFT_2086032 [Boletus coccyginus]